MDILETLLRELYPTLTDEQIASVAVQFRDNALLLSKPYTYKPLKTEVQG